MKPKLMQPCLLVLLTPWALLALFLEPQLAAAGSPARGLRLGYTHDSGYAQGSSLNQIHIGAHATVVHLSPNIHVAPSFEVGFQGGTLLALNGDVFYEFTELASNRWSYYAGGGPLLSRYSRNGRSSTDFALSLVAGVTHEPDPGRTLFGEVRLGLEDAPVLKITTGLTFF